MKTDGELFAEFSELLSAYTIACLNLYLAPPNSDKESLRTVQHELRIQILQRYNELLTDKSLKEFMNDPR